jgi:hypothetical protein
MKQLVTINLTNRTTTDWTPPEVAFGEDLTLAMRFRKNSGGNEVDSALEVTSLTAALGQIDQRPVGGKFALKLGPGAITSTNTTEVIDLDADLDAQKLAAALQPVATELDLGQVTVEVAEGSWLILFGEQAAEVEIEVVKNTLQPVSYGVVMAAQVDGKWIHELRLVQSVVAATSTVEEVLPPPPVITRLQAGGALAGDEWNEVQELYIPPEFRGSYIIKRGYLKTEPLSRENTLEDILEALQALGAGDFKVTLPLSNRVAIEFIGDLAGASQDLLAVEVKQSPIGDTTFTLQLDRWELATRLRSGQPITLPLEIRITGTEAGTDTKLAIALPVTVRPPLVWPVIEGMPSVDLVRPVSPRSYVPFGAGNSITAGRAYQATVGNGEATTFVVPHGLASEAVVVFVRENVAGGRLLVPGTDFEVAIDSANQVTVTALLDAPGTNGWRIVVLSALAASQWATDLTVTVPQVVAGSGYPALPDFMDSLSERVDTIEGLLGVAGAGGATETTPLSPIGLVPVAEAIPALVDWDGEKLVPALPRAVFDSSTGTISGEELAEPTLSIAGEVRVWGSTSEVYLTEGSQHRRGRVVTPADAPAVLCDGYNWWLAAGGTGGTSGSTFWPIEMNRTLWEIAVTPELLAPGRKLTVTWSVLLALLAEQPELRGVYTLRVRKGTMTTESGMTGNNVEAVTWDQDGGSEQFLFEQRISLSRAAILHPFTVQITRAAGGALSATKSAYGQTVSAPAPLNTQFVLRCELARFDLENYAQAMGIPKGQVIVVCGNGTGAKDILGKFDFGAETPTPSLAAIIS